MDSYSNRASSLFTTFTTVLFTFAALNHLTYYFTSPSPIATVQLPVSDAITEFSEYKQYKADQVKFDFDLSYDLSTEYNWNVNQIYLYVVASYETSKNKRNEIVVYDTIIQDQSEYKARFHRVKSRYILRDEYKGLLAGKNVHLSVRYQVMPVFGLLQIKNAHLSSTSRPTFTVPEKYFTKK